MNFEDPEDQRFILWLAEAKRLLGVRSLYGKESVDGYSIVSAIAAYTSGDEPLAYAQAVNLSRHYLSLPMLGEVPPPAPRKSDFLLFMTKAQIRLKAAGDVALAVFAIAVAAVLGASLLMFFTNRGVQ